MYYQISQMLILAEPTVYHTIGKNKPYICISDNTKEILGLTIEGKLILVDYNNKIREEFSAPFELLLAYKEDINYAKKIHKYQPWQERLYYGKPYICSDCDL